MSNFYKLVTNLREFLYHLRTIIIIGCVLLLCSWSRFV